MVKCCIHFKDEFGLTQKEKVPAPCDNGQTIEWEIFQRDKFAGPVQTRTTKSHDSTSSLKKKLTMSQPTKGNRPVTRAKNATQRPGQVILDFQQKRRNPVEMSKVRAQERLELGIAEKNFRTALKNVAKVQDRQQAEDVEEERRVVAPSLRRHETLLTPHINASTADESTDSEKEKTDTNDDESDAGPPDPPDDSYVETDEYVEDKSPAPEYSDAEMADIEEDLEVKQVAVQRSKPGKGTKGKKKKGEEIQTLINTMHKNPRPVGEIPKKLDLVLVTKVPPIPATKGKKARATCVFTSVPYHVLTNNPSS